MRSAVQQYGAHPKFTGNCAHKIINIKEIPWIYNQLLKMDKFANQKKNVIFQVVTCPSSWGTLYLFTYLSIYLSVHLSIYLLLHSWTWIPGSLWRTEAGVSQLNLDSRVTVELRNLPTYLSIYLFIYLPIYLSIYCFTVEPGFQGHCEGLRLGFHSWTWIPGSLWSSAIYLPTYLSIYLPTYLSIYLSIRPSIYLSIASQLNLDSRVTVKDWGWGFTVEPGFQGHCGAPQSTYLPIYLFIYLPTYLSIYLSVHLSIYLLLHSWTWIPGSLWRTEAGVSQLNLDSRVTVELRNGTWNPGSILLNKEGLEQGPHHSPEKGEPWARAGSGT